MRDEKTPHVLSDDELEKISGGTEAQPGQPVHPAQPGSMEPHGRRGSCSDCIVPTEEETPTPWPIKGGSSG